MFNDNIYKSVWLYGYCKELTITSVALLPWSGCHAAGWSVVAGAKQDEALLQGTGEEEVEA